MDIYSPIKKNKHLTTLFAANLISQVIPVLFSPLLTRIYTPDQFGLYALFFSLVNIFTVLISMRFENVFFIKKTYYDTKKSVSIFIGISLVIFLISILLFSLLVLMGIHFQNRKIITLALTSSILNVLSIYLLTYTNRLGLYNLMGQYKIVKVFILVLFQILLGYIIIKYNGLIISYIISLIIVVSYYSKKLEISMKSIYRSISLNRIKEIFKRYKLFPLYSMPTSLIDTLNASLPIFLLGFFYSDDIVGYYSLAFKVAYIPIILISISLSESLKKKISILIRENISYKSEVIKWFKILLPTSGLIIFGKNWAYSGSITKVLSIMFFFRILVNPFGFIFIVSERQKILFFTQISTLIVSVISLYLGYLIYQDAIMSILFYSITYSIKYIAEAYFIMKISPHTQK